MVFSSIIFIFGFLPCVLMGYYAIFNRSLRLQNSFLLLCSIFFYAWGGIRYTPVIIVSIIANWCFALLISNNKNRAKPNTSKRWLVLAIVFNIAVLFVFKYLNFTVENINTLFKSDINISKIVIPIGISFFTFQGMSYVIDVFKDRGKALKNPLEVGLYISFFSQLIAGPIVRYETVADQIHNRKKTISLFYDGIERFIFGLAKKAILANTLAIITNQVFSQYYSSSAMSAWLGAVAYTLQIYFDFSGYSDMAIGLGKMFGFRFDENFNYPYISSSITEFWRRWHISMGTWFRDYVYFPLGGSRVKSAHRAVFNLFIVWLLTGIWHGANWTFIVWGLIQFLVILLERVLRRKTSKKMAFPAFKHFYTTVVIVFSWVVFNSPSLGIACKYIKSMLCIKAPFIDDYFLFSIKENAAVLIVAIICCFPMCRWFKKKISQDSIMLDVIKTIFLSVLFVISIAYVVKGAYNPFIYFNF